MFLFPPRYQPSPFSVTSPGLGLWWLGFWAPRPSLPPLILKGHLSQAPRPSARPPLPQMLATPPQALSHSLGSSLLVPDGPGARRTIFMLKGFQRAFCNYSAIIKIIKLPGIQYYYIFYRPHIQSITFH